MNDLFNFFAYCLAGRFGEDCGLIPAFLLKVTMAIYSNYFTELKTLNSKLYLLQLRSPCQVLRMNPSHVGREQIIENNMAALGSPSRKTLDHEQIIALGKFLGFPSLLDTFPSFKRMRIGGLVYHSLSHKQVTARNSYSVLFQDNGPHCNYFF